MRLQRLGLLLLLVSAASACVTGTAYQRALRLQEGAATPEEIARGLEDPNWKLRCLAARACDSSACREKLKRVVITGDGQLKQCALHALSDRCSPQSAALLSELLRENSNDAQIQDAFGRCPDADTLYAVLSEAPALSLYIEALDQRFTGPGASNKSAWIESLMKVPGSTDRLAAAFPVARKEEREAEQAELRRREEEARLQALREEEERRIAAAMEELRQKEEAERLAREAKWGPFSTWRERQENTAVLKTLRKLILQEATLKKLADEYEEEKQSNDDSVRSASFFPVPIYGETTGSFAFVKILDRTAGEALFSASDGLFVLELSEGDSFQAYPGQNVHMTMHSRGETMLMTTGRRLPVFRSGSSPVTTRRIPGFKPSRKNEQRLRRKVLAVQKAFEGEKRRNLSPAGEEGRWVVKGAHAPARLILETTEESGWRRAVVEDLERESEEVYCISIHDSAECEKSLEPITLETFSGTEEAE